MTGFLVDTNIVSEFSRTHPDPGVQAWAQDVRQFALSVVSVEEIRFGLAWRPNTRIGIWMDGFFERHTILPITEPVAHRAGELRGQLAALGLVLSQADMLIAATAQVHQLVLATRNTKDFQGCGISLVNPFGERLP